MRDTLVSLEQRLIAGYRQQASHYEQALQMLEQRDTAALGEERWVTGLQVILQTVAELNARMADDKAGWGQAQRSPEAELRVVLDDVAARIRLLGERIDAAVADLVARKRRLLPEIDDFIRQRWMLAAYGRQDQAASR